MFNVVVIFTLLCCLLIVYHHVLYPMLLKKMSSKRDVAKPHSVNRHYAKTAQDSTLPSITIIVPAYNEASFIAEKLRNLAQLDYPEDKLHIALHLDGCTDNTAQIAKEVLGEMECQSLSLTIHNHAENRGKLAVINLAISLCKSDLVVLTDVSALLPVDSLLTAVAHFSDANVGAVSGGYRLLNSKDEGEKTYWQYQSKIKTYESALGSVMGCHGAFYVFRPTLFQPLENGIINDDFILPMSIAAQGYRVVYEPEACSLELEVSNEQIENKRRKRIAAGNMQQLIKLLHLLKPRYGWLAFNFASGKALRAVMPFCLLGALLGSLWLAQHAWLFAAMAICQFGIYFAVALLHLTHHKPKNKLLRVADYMVCGHWSGLIGTLRYVTGLENGRWHRAGE